MIPRSILLVALSLSLTCVVRAEDVVLVGGSIIDGSGKAAVVGNVRIRDGKVQEIGTFRVLPSDKTIDVKDLVVAPGIIDIDNHSGGFLDVDTGASTQILQGITTAVVGLDGEGPIRVEEFMARFERHSPALNVMTFAGHNTARREVLGQDFKRAATPDEIRRMEALVEQAMRQGAFGLSSNLEFGPGTYAAADEVTALAKVVARYAGVYAIHLRSEQDKVIEAVREAIDVGRRAKVPIHISHLRLGSASVWGKAPAVLAEIATARSQGVDVTADVSPYESFERDINASPADVRTFVSDSSVIVASDGGLGYSHPKAAGTFPRVLGPFVRDEKLLKLELAIRKMTALPAARFGLKERSVLLKGAAADVIVFDPSHIQDRATVQNPSAPAEGMKYVFVNGVMVVSDGRPTADRPGVSLR